MNKFTIYLEDETLDGLLHQVWDFLNAHKGFCLATDLPEVNTVDFGREDQVSEGSSIGDDQSEGDG